MNDGVDLEIKVPDLENGSVLQDLSKTRGVVKVVKYLDQPIKTRLNSLLQLTYQYAKDV